MKAREGIGGSRSIPRDHAPTFHSVAETAVILRMSEVTLYRAINAGEFPAVRVRGRLIVPARVIEDMVEAALADHRQVDAADWVSGSDADANSHEGPGGIAPRRGRASQTPGEDSMPVQRRGWRV